MSKFDTKKQMFYINNEGASDTIIGLYPFITLAEWANMHLQILKILGGWEHEIHFCGIS